MALELVHTSATAGLHPGTSGFCTVAMTTGMPAAIEERLAALSGFRPVGAPGSSPPSFSHLRLEIGGRTWSVLGVVREAPPDHSGRSNKLAHHLVLAPHEQGPAGPAWLLGASGVMLDRFDGPPRWIPQPRSLPDGPAAGPRRADAWEDAAGDAGWAGELVNQWHLDPSRTNCIVYGPACDPLRLVDEALSLLPPRDRWKVTFATHFQHPVAGAPCAWRFCLEGTQAAQEAPGRATGLHLDLAHAKRSGSRAGQGRYAELARSGDATWWNDAASATEAAGRAAADDSRGAALPWTGVVSAEAASHRMPQRMGTAAGRGAAGGGADVGSGDGAVDGPAPPGAAGPVRRLAPWLVAVPMLLVGAAAGLLAERWLIAPGAHRAGAGDAAKAGDEIDRLDAARREFESQLRKSEQERADARAESRRLSERLASAERERDSARAQLRSIEALSAPAPATAPAAGPASASATGPATATGTATTPGASPANGGAAVPPTSVPGDSEIVLPDDAWNRDRSTLGAIATDRRRLLVLPRSVRSLEIEIPPWEPGASLRRSGDGRTTTIAAAPRDLPRRDVITLSAEGAELFAQWLLTGPPGRIAPYFDAVDPVLASISLRLTMEDGSVTTLVPAPRRIELRIPSRGDVESPPISRSPSMRLIASAAPGWTLADGATETTLRLEHAAGSLRADLDRTATGRLRIRFVSPLLDALDAAETERRELEADRPNVPSEERPFHDARERDVRERIERLKTQIAADKPSIPAALPELRITMGSSGRTLAVVTLVAADAPERRR